MRKWISLFVVVLSLAASGCAETTDATGPSDGAVVLGTTSANQLEIQGLLTSVDLRSRTLRVADTLVRVPAGTNIRRGSTSLEFSALRVGDPVDIRATFIGSTLTAFEVHLRTDNSGPGNTNDDDEDDDDGDVELKGIVSGRAGTCPAISFRIGNVLVVTNASTVFDDDPCSGIANGDNLEVHGVRQPDGSVVARRIEDEDDDDDDNEGHEDDDEVDLRGILSGRSGTCPSISFSVLGTPVVTNSRTEFRDGSCASLIDGTRVEVRGPRQANGSVLAERVKRESLESFDAGTCCDETPARSGISVLDRLACQLTTGPPHDLNGALDLGRPWGAAAYPDEPPVSRLGGENLTGNHADALLEQPAIQ